MKYKVLTMGLTDNLLTVLQMRLNQCDLHFFMTATVREGSRLLHSQIFHLLIVDLEYLRSIRKTGWLADIRRISFVPVHRPVRYPRGGCAGIGASRSGYVHFRQTAMSHDCGV